MPTSALEVLSESGSSYKDWCRDALIPKYGLAVLQALQFSKPDTKILESLNEAGWKRVLQFCDSSQLTLILGKFCRRSLPDWVRARIDLNYSNNTKRFERLNAALFEVADSLESRNIEFVMLKGQSHSPRFTPDPQLRAQGDIDLWCLPKDVVEARNALLELGYLPSAKAEGRHLPPMARPSHWEWRGDYFALDLPMAVDLHYRLWDQEKERIAGPPEDNFWDRRQQMVVERRILPVLCEADTLAFAALHLLMHVLRGDLRLQRAWEIAHFIHSRADDEKFWRKWKLLHPPDLRRLEIIMFILSAEWFGCRWPMLLSGEAENLSDDVKLWIRRYALKPVQGLFRPNKDELWLHLSLLSLQCEKIRVFARRTLPLPLPARQSEPAYGAPQAPARRMLEFKFLLSRFTHHAGTLFPTFSGALLWWWRRQELGRDFVVFLLSSAFFDFGEFIFFLLFNLYLLGLGFDEKFLGQVASLMTVGTIVGAIPAVALTRRIGLRLTLLIAIIGAPAAGALRAVAVSKLSVLAGSFLAGTLMSIWAVSFAPAISATTNHRNRPFGFSLVTAMGIGLGSLAGILGGHLPGWLEHISPSLGAIETKRIALLTGCAIAALGAIPVTYVSFKTVPREKRSYPRSKFMWSFLAALLIWSLATGAFNPFFNAYFSRHQHMSVEKIGFVFSLAQFATVAAVLLAPLVLKKLGHVKGVTAMQAATAITLASLALAIHPSVAALMYVSYMSFQYMSEPALFSMLMNRVHPGERSGASALNFLTISMAGSLSALISGAAISRFGYSAVLAIAAALAMIAAALFLTLIREEN